MTRSEARSAAIAWLSVILFGGLAVWFHFWPLVAVASGFGAVVLATSIWAELR